MITPCVETIDHAFAHRVAVIIAHYPQCLAAGAVADFAEQRRAAVKPVLCVKAADDDTALAALIASLTMSPPQ